MRILNTWRAHWPEYLIEAWALGMFMVSAGMVTVAFEYPGSWLHSAIIDPLLRRAGIGIAMGLTAIALIYSRFGQQSGAHMNPAVTLTYWSLGKVAGADAIGYVLAQLCGGTLGVLLVASTLGARFTAPPVSYVATLPGTVGTSVAFFSEVGISFVLMWTVLMISNRPSLARFTGYCAGALVALYITFEAPLSGMSMNPARSFASAMPSGLWQGYWIYLSAPVIGMLAAARCYIWRNSPAAVHCAKLLHPDEVRCIHCGMTPPRVST